MLVDVKIYGTHLEYVDNLGQVVIKDLPYRKDSISYFKDKIEKEDGRLLEVRAIQMIYSIDSTVFEQDGELIEVKELNSPYSMLQKRVNVNA